MACTGWQVRIRPLPMVRVMERMAGSSDGGDAFMR